MIEIRELREARELHALVDLQRAIWQMPPADCVSPHTMRAVIHNGGVVIGALAGDEPVGLCFGFASKRGARLMLWSFMAGVRPDYQGQGIGYQLKQAQRAWAQAQGYDTIGWTFDPMQRGNANFNFNRLGVTARHYHEDFYGEMDDALNTGLASDRLEAEWPVTGDAPAVASDAGPLPFLLRRENERMITSRAALAGSACALEIPFDLKALKRDDMATAANWQQALRGAIQEALAAGLVVTGFEQQEARCWYVLRRLGG
jgi:predicted GNAT superfamily acetyltransferase